jgi:hypothetical protein
MTSTLRFRFWPALVPPVAALLLAGCGGGPSAPVSGKVTLGKKPLTAGVITYSADHTKGNNNKYIGSSKIGTDGSYTIGGEGKENVPLGWYKVTVVTSGPMDEKSAVKPVAINPKYTSTTTTPLSVEVKQGAAPGVYDFDLKK